MCGLVGIAGNMSFKDEAIMKMLLCFDYFRGPDSTGLAAISKTKNEVAISKMASHPFDLFGSSSFKSALSGYNSSVFLGHNRAATRGVVTGYNAHPFECGDIVGAHNGTLTPASIRELEEALGETFDVDSHAIFEAIDKLGIRETVKMLQGAWALVWYDFKDDSINFLRNGERPFWLAYSEDCKRMFWASEYPIIQAACKMAKGGQELFADKEGFSYWSTEVDKHYKFELSEVIAGGERPPKPTVAILKGKEPVKVVKPTGGVASPFIHPRLLGQNGTKTSTTTSLGKTEETQEKVVHILKGSPSNPFAGYFTQQEMELLGAEGCTFCGGEVDVEAGGITVFEEENIILCKNCTNHSEGSSRVYVDKIVVTQ